MPQGRGTPSESGTSLTAMNEQKSFTRIAAAHLQFGSRARYVAVFVFQTSRPSWTHEFSWPSSFLICWRSLLKRAIEPCAILLAGAPRNNLRSREEPSCLVRQPRFARWVQTRLCQAELAGLVCRLLGHPSGSYLASYCFDRSSSMASIQLEAKVFALRIVQLPAQFLLISRAMVPGCFHSDA